MSIERLADVLIASRCGTHSLGLVYEFLLKAHGSPKQASADFVSYLSGELPARLLKEARLWVAEEQGCKAPTLIDEDDLVEQLPGNSSLIPQAQSKSQYSTNSGQSVGMTKQPSMHSRKFGSKEALIAYAKQNGLTCLSASFAKWQQLLSPKEYLLVEVLTSGRNGNPERFSRSRD